MPETDSVLEKSTSDTAKAQITSVNKILFKTPLASLPDCWGPTSSIPIPRSSHLLQTGKKILYCKGKSLEISVKGANDHVENAVTFVMCSEEIILAQKSINPNDYVTGHNAIISAKFHGYIDAVETQM